MTKLKQIVLASHNKSKLKELQNMLSGYFEIHSIADFSTIEPEETGLSFIENAILKARYASKISGLPALADDSGLAVDILKGAPGIYSARYAKHGDDNANNDKLLNELKNTSIPQRTAQFICALAMVQHELDPIPIVCEGIWQGHILPTPKGKNGFGYDPLFWIEQYQCSSAELEPQLKNQISHRAKAMALLKQRLNING